MSILDHLTKAEKKRVAEIDKRMGQLERKMNKHDSMKWYLHMPAWFECGDFWKEYHPELWEMVEEYLDLLNEYQDITKIIIN